MKHESNLVSIHKVYDSIEAELIKSQLEAEGIISFLKSDNAGGSLSYFTATLGIEIIVRKEDAERAFNTFIRNKVKN
ncbi:MAG: putative signal transducing protein [Chlamydiales bacterium]